MSNANSTLMIQIRSVTDAGNVKYKTRPATPEEIKAAHGKCLTCKWKVGTDEVPECSHKSRKQYSDQLLGCYNGDIDDPATDYCNYHEPKET